MKRLISTLFLLAGTAGTLAAQQPQAAAPPQPQQQERADPSWGIGVSLNPAALINLQSGSLVPIGLGDLYLPINASPTLRVEPEFGLLTTSSSTSGSGGSTSSSATSLRVAVGIFSLLERHGSARLYVGPRIGIMRTSSSSSFPGSPTATSSETDLMLAMALGGEYFFSPHFSLGGEAQLQYVKYGTPSVSPSQGTQPDVSRHLISTNELVFVRLYP